MLREACHLLTDYYVETRYPVHWPIDLTRADAEEARSACVQIRTVILGKLP